MTSVGESAIAPSPDRRGLQSHILHFQRNRETQTLEPAHWRELFSVFVPKVPSSQWAGDNHEAVRVYLKAISVLSDEKAAKFMLTGRYRGFRIPSLESLTLAMSYEDVGRLTMAAANKGPACTKAAFVFLKEWHPEVVNVRDNTHSKFGHYLGDNGDNLEMLEDGLAALQRILATAEPGDREASKVMQAVISGLLHGTAARSKERSISLVKNLEVIFPSLNPEIQFFLASKIYDLHFDETLTFIDHLALEGSDRVSMAAVQSLWKCQQIEAGAEARHLVTVFQREQSGQRLMILALRIAQDTSHHGAEGQEARRFAQWMSEHENPYVRIAALRIYAESHAFSEDEKAAMFARHLQDPNLEIRSYAALRIRSGGLATHPMVQKAMENIDPEREIAPEQRDHLNSIRTESLTSTTDAESHPSGAMSCEALASGQQGPSEPRTISH